MKEIIAYCGLHCHECPALEITLADDDARRAELAAQWSKEYGADIKPEHINCLGCTVDTDVHIGHWYECEYRKCAQQHGAATCGHCEDFPCQSIEQFFTYVPAARQTLENITK